MSLFAKRKARKIPTFDDGEDAGVPVASSEPTLKEGPSETSGVSLSFGKRPHKQSSLRRSINVNDDDDSTEGGAPTATSTGPEDGDEGPVVIKPTIGRSGSTKLKKRASSSRLSFGVGESLADDGGSEVLTPKRSSLGQRVLENSAFRKSISTRLPTRSIEEDGDRPRYSKQYLEELQSSTPNTPQNLSTLQINDDAMDLDPSELDGAMVVESSELAPRITSNPPQTLSEAEIQEKKERRARLAKQEQFISLDGSDNEGNGGYISLLPRKKEATTRLIAEDEDLGEGFDEFVEDERLALGKKAEREAKKRRKKEMAEMINAAEEDDDASDDSEAERRAAYEVAQTRAGMDGLQRQDDITNGDGPVFMPKMKPLPELADCLAKMQSHLQGLEGEVAKKRKNIADLEKEKDEILSREKEVQEILDKAGQKYQTVIGSADAAKLATQSPLRPIPAGLMGEFPVERGLESLGTTPTRRADVDEPT